MRSRFPGWAVAVGLSLIGIPTIVVAQPAAAQTSGWWPGNPSISQGYGPTSLTLEPPGHGFAHWHAGIDVAMACGTPLSTPYWATVENDADAIPNGFGSIHRTLRLDDGHDVILGHVQAWYPAVGTRIPPGTRVADAGTQGNSTGCHVHFEVRPAGGRFGSDVDPTAWMTGVAPSGTLWGVDTNSPTSPSFVGQVTTALGAPQFVGRYFTLPPGAGTPLSQAEASSLSSQGLPILLLNSPNNSNLTAGSTAVTEANAAVAQATVFGVPQGTALFRDVENSYQIDSAYITAWYNTIAGAGYVPGFYENPLPGSSGFSSAYCAAVSGQASIGAGTVLYSDEPESGTSFARSDMPAYAPSAPPCANTTIAWQYLIQAPSVNVDVDEVPAQYGHYLWGGTVIPPQQAAVTTTVSSSTNPSVFGQPVTLTVTVAPQAANPNTPTGVVKIFDGSTQIGSGNLAGGSFSITTSTLSVGTHAITASYAGDSNFVTGTSAVLNQVVNKAPTITALTASPPGSSGFGNPVTFTATVSVPPPGAGTPTGNIAFTVDGTHVGQATLTASLTASITTSALSPGSHAIGASYNGDANFLASAATLNYLITCTNTITGTHPGAVIASGSSTCVLGAHIGGAIIVPASTALAVETSTVGGGIVANSSPHAIQICGSTIGGTVGVSGAQGLVIIGDQGDAICAVNTFKGALTVRNNSQGVEIIGNTIVGALLASNNSGPWPYPGDISSVSSNSKNPLS